MEVALASDVAEVARRRLREAIAVYGRAAFAEPRRCEAILRDCCPNAPREVFLLVSALRENVAEELSAEQTGMPAEALVARLTRRLSDHLGLSEDSARWAVESWRYGLENNPGLRAGREAMVFPAGEARARNESRFASGGAAVNWPWLGTCLVAIVSALAGLGTVVAASFCHLWRTWPGGLLECGALAFVLAGAGCGLRLARRAFEQMTPPEHTLLDPRTAAFALLPEVLILLALPLVAVGAPFAWVMEWWLGWHFVGAAHGAAFHVVRSMESLCLGAFLYFWIGDMTPIQGRIACSLVRRR
ncbi:MAG TPA: hypothetical protein VKV17_16315 [Bryobacteraceae bacterium]|nr:hypothetical protein [Bryobacteraceae bacterium]